MVNGSDKKLKDKKWQGFCYPQAFVKRYRLPPLPNGNLKAGGCADRTGRSMFLSEELPPVWNTRFRLIRSPINSWTNSMHAHDELLAELDALNAPRRFRLESVRHRPARRRPRSSF